MCWNNFFGNTPGVANVYFGKLFDGAERDAYISLVMGMALVGGTIGALVVMPFVLEPKNGENFFDAMWLALGLTCVSFTLVTVVLSDPDKVTRPCSHLSLTLAAILAIAVALVLPLCFSSPPSTLLPAHPHCDRIQKSPRTRSSQMQTARLVFSYTCLLYTSPSPRDS